MYNFLTIFIQMVNPIFDHVNLFCNALLEAVTWPATGEDMTLAFALGAAGYVLPEGIRPPSCSFRKTKPPVDEGFFTF
jgi:hypothetical protein